MRRERSDTIVARPVFSSALLGTGTSVLQQENVGVDIVMGEENNQDIGTIETDDELLLTGPWHDEDWEVAGPSSPQFPRRKGARKAKGWLKGWEAGLVRGRWMTEHDEDDGEDDPLLLK